MLKHLYKTLLISVISWSLLTVQSSVVFAATSETKATVTTDSNGVITSKKSVNFDKIADTDMLASITMLAGGYITGRMWQAYTPVSTDVTIAAAGGVAFIAGEIMTNVKFKGTIEAMTVEVEKKSDGTINEEQQQRLEDLKKSYEEAKKTTKTKKTLQLASAAAFTAAALTATYYAMSETGGIAACQTALTSAQGTLAGCMKTGVLGYTATEAAACASCATALKTYHTTLAKYSATREMPDGLSAQKDAQTITFEALLTSETDKAACSGGTAAKSVSTAVAGLCSPVIKLMIADQQSAKKINIVNNQKEIRQYLGLPKLAPIAPLKTNLFANYIERSLSLLFPQAHASWLPLLGLGAGTALAFTGILGTMGVSVDTYMYVPRNRAIAFGVLAGVALMASKSSDNVIKKLDENIEKIDAILNDMKKLTKGVKAQNLQNQSISIKTVNPAVQNVQPYSTDGITKSPCMASNSSENCTALADKLSSMPGFANLPDSLKGIASQSVSLGDSLSGSSGISGSTLTSAEALGNKQNALNKALKKQQAALTKITKGGYDTARDEKKFQDKVNAALRKELQKHGMTATGFMASVGGTPINSSLAKDDASDAKGKKGEFEGNAVNLAAGEAAPEAGKEEGLKLEFKDSTGAGESYAMAAPSVSGNDQYDVKTDEINRQNGPSIFELISRRYIKSGYPKLLEEEPAKN